MLESQLTVGLCIQALYQELTDTDQQHAQTGTCRWEVSIWIPLRGEQCLGQIGISTVLEHSI